VVHEHVARALDDRASRLVHLDAGEVFVEYIAAPLSFVIFGAGHDAIPLARAAQAVGWHVTVADGRPAYARAERFPGIDRVVRLAADVRLGGIDIDRTSAVVLMTHNFPHDTELLRDLLPHRPRYLGLLGSRQRSERLFAELETDIAAHDVHAPVGLDIGSDTPELIALSIVAEIQAVLSGRTGGRLSLRNAPIHSPALEIGAPTGHRRAPVERPVCALAANDG
jgi:xanthine/CO dehydrogenase XdhC/CoxF family maturation factor